MEVENVHIPPHTHVNNITSKGWENKEHNDDRCGGIEGKSKPKDICYIVAPIGSSITDNTFIGRTVPSLFEFLPRIDDIT